MTCVDTLHNLLENVANEKCSIYFPTPNGPQCFCDPTNKDYTELCESKFRVYSYIIHRSYLANEVF